jgi:uncharacterized protein with PQ loop repeat
MSLELIGWIGAIAFALCGLPQAILSYKQGHAMGISWGFLGLWYVGEICTLIYIMPTQQWPLIFNYVMNLLFVTVVLRYKIWPRSRSWV